LDYKLLGKRIKNERMKLKITQAKLAEDVDLSVSHIALIERAHRIPSLDTLFKIAIRLEVSIDYLLNIHFVSNDDDLTAQLKQIFNSQDEQTKIMTIDILKAISNNYDNK